MSTAAPLTQPRSFGRYELVHMLAQGGMGEVYLAKLTGAAGFEKLCIVKTILQRMSADRQFVDRFHHEARVLVQLTHASIAQVYDMGEIDNSFYMAMEYIAGVDVARVQDRARELKAQVPIGIALYVGQKMAEALGYAHRKVGSDGTPLGIVHRDVSPQNVMVSYEGDVKVIDFGLAKSAARSKHTQPSTVLGKLGYMSPEQARGEPVDHRSDIYSCAVVIWELLAGRELFLGQTVGEMVAQMSNPKVPSLKTIRPEISENIEKVLLRALAANPADRYGRADDLARALNEQLVRENANIGAEEVGNYVRGLCPEEFVEQRKLISQLSTFSKRGSEPGVEPVPQQAFSPDVPLSATALRATPQPGAGLSGTAIRATPQPGAGLSGTAIRQGATPAPAGEGASSGPGTTPRPPQAGEGGHSGIRSGATPLAVSGEALPAPMLLQEREASTPAAVLPGGASGSGEIGSAQAFIGGHAAVASAPGPAASAPSVSVAPPQREDLKSRAPLFAILAVLVIAGAAGLAFLAARKGESGPPPPPAKFASSGSVSEPVPTPPSTADEEPVAAGEPVAGQRVPVRKAFEIFIDRGDHFLRAGSAEGVTRGTRILVVKGEGPTREKVGEATAMEVWLHLTRLSVDGPTQQTNETLFGAFEHRGRIAKGTGRPARAEPPAPAPTPAAAVAPTPEPSKPASSLKGRAFLSGIGPLRRLNLSNADSVKWTECEARLPTNQRYVFDQIAPGDSDGALLRKFAQDGVERDVPLDWVSVKCNQGSARFSLQ